MQRWERRTHVGHTAREEEDFRRSAMEPGVPSGTGRSLTDPSHGSLWALGGESSVGGNGEQGATGRLDMQCLDEMWGLEREQERMDGKKWSVHNMGSR